MRIWPDCGRRQKADIGITGARRGWPSLLEVHRKIDGRVLTGGAGVARNLDQYLPTARSGSALPRKAGAGEQVVRKRPYSRTRFHTLRDS